LAIGFSEIGTDDFYQPFVEQFDWIKTTFPATYTVSTSTTATLTTSNTTIPETKQSGSSVLERECLARFNNREISDYLVIYGRFLCSSHIQYNAEQYKPFLQGKSIHEFCQVEVEPVNRESDYVQCMSLASELSIGVCIEYLDQSDGSLNSHVLPNAAVPKVFLLYRPGHYDVLYPK